jgi:hypothetical protein
MRTAALLACTALLGCGGRAETPAARGAPATATDERRVARQTVSDDGDESITDFYLPLAAYGDWVDDPAYGSVWSPGEDIVGADFVPYVTDGAWLRTDAGWVFRRHVDDAWSLAAFHYGRWLDSDAHGWVWVPDVVWGPSWVDFRHGGGWVGWAPTAPDGAVAARDAYTFVETARILEPVDAAAEHRNEPDVARAFAETRPSPGRGRRAGPPDEYLAAAGVATALAPYPVPGPGAIRTQGRLAATRARPYRPPKKKADATGAPAPARSSHGRRGR